MNANEKQLFRKALTREPAAALPDDFTRRLLERIERDTLRRERRAERWQIAAAIAAVAAVVIVVTVATPWLHGVSEMLAEAGRTTRQAILDALTIDALTIDTPLLMPLLLLAGSSLCYALLMPRLSRWIFALLERKQH